MSSKILLIADVGTNADGFYHVGDEAMLYQTVLWYQHHAPSCKLGVLSRSISHTHLRVREQLHLPFPYADYWISSPWYCFHLIVRVVLQQILNLPVLRKRERDYIDFVQSFDVWHFTGGGNIYSHHPPWLYYVFFLLILGKLLRKKIWLISQTLGPFNWFDGQLAKFLLRFADVLVLRGEGQAQKWQCAVGLDAAYHLPLLPKPVLPKKTAKTLRIGLSLHDWQGFGPKLSQIVVAALSQLAQKHRIELVLLPHVLVTDEAAGDFGFMHPIAQQLQTKCAIISLRPKQIMAAKEPSILVKTATAELDLLIATRYHGLVFALSSNVPVVTFKLDEYYVVKNTELLGLVYKNNWQRFVADLEFVDAAKKLSKTIAALHRNLVVENQLLKTANLRLNKTKELNLLPKLVEKLGG